MNIGIIGAGKMGTILARHLTKLGYRVSIANSRRPESLTTLAAETGAKPVSVDEAAEDKDVVIIAIPTKAFPDLPKDLLANIPKSTAVVDTSNYHPELRDGRIEAIEQGMLESQWVAQQLGCPVIKAFNNILDQSLLTKRRAKGSPDRIALSAAGDSVEAKAIVLRLIDDLGFDPVDSGDLENSWRQQTGSPAYCKDLIESELRGALANADQTQIAAYRTAEEARIKRLFAAQSV